MNEQVVKTLPNNKNIYFTFIEAIMRRKNLRICEIKDPRYSYLLKDLEDFVVLKAVFY